MNRLFSHFLFFLLCTFKMHCQFYTSVNDSTGQIYALTSDNSNNLIYSTTNFPLIAKCTPNNQTVLWSDRFDSTYFLSFNPIETQGSNIISVTNMSGSPYSYSLLRKMNQNGAIIWSKKLSTTTNIIFQTLLVAKDKSIYLGTGACGITNCILKLDSTGSIIWVKEYTDTFLSGYITSLKEDPYGNVFVSARDLYSSAGTVLLFFKIDKNGNLIWNKSYQLEAAGVAKLNSKRELIYGGTYTDVNLVNKAIHFKLDSVGNLLWKNEYLFPNCKQSRHNDFELDANDDIISTGTYNDTVTGINPGSLLKLNGTTGSVLASRKTDTLNFTVIKYISNSLIPIGGLSSLNAYHGILTSIDNNLNSSCFFNSVAAFSASLTLPQITIPVTPTNISISVTGLTEVFQNQPINRTQVCSVLNIENTTNTISLSMYPNPTSGLFTMDMNASSQLIITNTLGQEILNERKEAGKQIIDIRNHPDGVYFVKVLSENRQQVFKLVKE